jgi:hypothetical protein
METLLPRDTRPAASGGTADVTVYFLMLVVGLAIVVPTLMRHLAWGVQPTLGALLVVLGGRAVLVAFVLRIKDRSDPGASRQDQRKISPHGRLY